LIGAEWERYRLYVVEIIAHPFEHPALPILVTTPVCSMISILIPVTVTIPVAILRIGGQSKQQQPRTHYASY